MELLKGREEMGASGMLFLPSEDETAGHGMIGLEFRGTARHC